MRKRDREVGLPMTNIDTARRVGEKLLLLDELEETLEQAEVSGGESLDRIEALQRRVAAERETVRAMKNRGELRYDEISRVMEAMDRSG